LEHASLIGLALMEKKSEKLLHILKNALLLTQQQIHKKYINHFVWKNAF